MSPGGRPRELDQPVRITVRIPQSQLDRIGALLCKRNAASASAVVRAALALGLAALERADRIRPAPSAAAD